MNISESCYYDIPSSKHNRHIFEFEKNFDYWGTFFWFVDNWKVCYYFIAIYLVVIFGGQHLMKHRQPYKLRAPLFFWNLSLALFSLGSLTRLVPEMLYMLENHGFYGTVCEVGPKQHKQVGGIYVYLFALSKIVELGDTVFIVLRKTPLIFLHWYHHISVILFTWGSSAYPSAMQRYFGIVNMTVHSFMYTYYALKVLRFRIPRAVSMAITSLQLLQMALGVFVAAYAYRAKAQDPDCCVFDQAITIAAGIYASYFILFMNYFVKVYINNKGSLFDEKGSIKKLS